MSSKSEEQIREATARRVTSTDDILEPAGCFYTRIIMCMVRSFPPHGMLSVFAQLP